MDLSKHLETAADAVKRRNYPYAIKLYGQLLGLQPDNGEARSGLRTALFKKAEQKPPSKLFALLGGGVNLLIGSVCRLCGAHGAAAKAYERYLTGDPLAEGANLKLGDSLQRAGLDNSARAVFHAYADANPRCLEACRRAGQLLYAAEDMPGAAAMFERALKIDPRDQESLKARKNLAAEGALRATGLETATSSRQLIKDIDKAKELERSDRLQLSKAEIEEELTKVEQQLQNEPQNTKLLVRMADLLTMDNDLQGALESLEQAVIADPHNTDVANRAGALRLKLQERRVVAAENKGDTAAADVARKALREARVVEFRRQVDRNPTDLRLRFQLGQALFEDEQYDPAIAELQQSVKDPKVKGESLLMMGQSFAAKQMDQLAMDQLEMALQTLQTSGQKGKEVLYAMGCVAQNMGQREQALAHFSKILAQDIGFRDVQDKVAALKSAS
ncbi:MAG: tetratricopeptide repeat protein [Planctomycetes bacterium]|nr:tetratricopeptide repeat protein [Planctomycetota bacterium]